VGTKITPSFEFPSICIEGKLITLDKPLVMGIINVNENSFYAPSRKNSLDDILSQTEKHLKAGAKFIDLGATSTKPGSKLSNPEDEIQTLALPLKEIKKEFPKAILSVDTYHSSVAREAVNLGASIINDISGGTIDPRMFDTIAEIKVPYILMHIQNTPENMQDSPHYQNVVLDIMKDLADKINELFSKGCSDIIIDPGFGFGKTVEHNFQILKSLELFKQFKLPILVGLSRKSMINKTLNISSNEALNGTTALHMLAMNNGAHILRVHDVKEAFESIELFDAYRKA
jgi:dihydropteroate synthase